MASPISFIKNTFRDVKIKDRINDESTSVVLNAIITKIIALSGIKDGISQADADDINEMIHIRFGFLTVDEILKAFQLERFGMYESRTEHFQLFNSVYVSTVLEKYIKWKADLRDKHKINPETLLLSKENQLSDYQKVEMVKSGLIEEFESFCENGDLSEVTAYLFDFLVRHGFIKMKNQSNAKYYDDKLKLARQLVLSESKAKLAEVNISPSLKSNLRTVVENIEDASNSAVIIKMKELVLKEFFTKKKENKKEFINQVKSINSTPKNN